MEYILKTENKEAFEWMQNLVNNTLESQGHQAAVLAYPHLSEWQKMFTEALAQAKNASEPKSLKEVQKSSTHTKKSTVAKKTSASPRKKRRTTKTKDKSGLTCNEHPTYTGSRIPRKDCKSCWGVYKKFHPEEYSAKRRSFLAKQKTNKA